MVIIKTTCPSCGEVDLTAEKVQLRIAIGGTGSSYAFDCPVCSDRIRKPADSRVVQLLIQGGIAPEVVGEDEASESFDEPAREATPRDLHPATSGRQAPPITYDDLLEFHREIEGGVLETFLRNAAA
ncbi:MAG TPA: hypothetical protein VKY26_01925, partial [Actinomycetota bacterium]|nr:hypothetical protein [Actinomycetota bacterium]